MVTLYPRRHTEVNLGSANYHHGDLKNALVRAARARIAEKGAASLNLRAVARVVGVTHPAAYRHFADKEALLEAVAQEGFDELADALRESVEGSEEGLEPTLFALANAYLNFAVSNPELTRVMFALIPAEARMKNERLYAASKRAYTTLTTSVEGLEGDTSTDSAVVWALLHGLAKLTIEKQVPLLEDSAKRKAVVVRAVGVLAKGLT